MENTEELAENLTVKLMFIMENWGLTDDEKISLLRLEDKIKPRHLYQYQRGNKYFDLDDNLVGFAKIILGIDDALKTSYPANQNYGRIWLKRVQKKFKGRTPLELMLRDKTGMNKVWHFLDCTQSWQD